MWADGEKEIGRFGEYNRTDVSLTQVPQHVQDAVLAAEDRRFYSHKGFSVQGFARALFSNIFLEPELVDLPSRNSMQN